MFHHNWLTRTSPKIQRGSPFARESRRASFTTDLFESLDQLSALNSNESNMLQQAKAGLMAVLLTGEVRVKVDASEAAA